ncbi:MAG: hypothetical protein JWP80_4420, partial [Pseudomonas sp.]|nr:hypothetical protein [Pseudomonas sp.]
IEELMQVQNSLKSGASFRLYEDLLREQACLRRQWFIQ